MRIPEIEKGIEIPSPLGAIDTTLNAMEPGDSIKLTWDEANVWRNRLSSHYPGQFTTRKIGPDTVRIWKK